MSDRSALILEIRLALRTMGAELGRLNGAVASIVDLREDDLVILDHIGRVEPASPGAIAEELGIHPATMTGFIDRLERGGWVRREPDASDRRRIGVTVVRDRAPEIARLYAPMNAEITKICADLDERDLGAVRDFLRAISAAADRSRGQIN